MVKYKIPAIIPMAFGIVFLSSCSVIKPLNFSSNRQIASVAAPATGSKFIEEITVTAAPLADKTYVASGLNNTYSDAAGSSKNVETPLVTVEPKQFTDVVSDRSKVIESASSVQLKYASLMQTDIESLPNKGLLEGVDKWYGVRYLYGGMTKKGIDCSAFTQKVYADVYGFNLPRTGREQYRVSRKISATELQEGDLLFFNTLGKGISHVGLYLGNNKFVHASCSRGVAISGLFESYYIKRFVGAGRIDDKQVIASN